MIVKGTPANRNRAPLRLLPLVESTPREAQPRRDGGSAPEPRRSKPHRPAKGKRP